MKINVEIVKDRVSVAKVNWENNEEFANAKADAYRNVLVILDDTLEVKEVDLEKAAMNYLLHEHISPLNKVFHQSDIKAEMQYHKDIENAFKMGFELGLKAKGEVYVVTRSEEHSDYVEAVFLSEDKAEEYCKPFNEDENCYARNITKVKIQ